MLWLDIATKVEVTYPSNQGSMENILGAVLHTTNTGVVMTTIEEFQKTWQDAINDPNVPAVHKQSAHFMVEQTGRIGQFRALNEVAWHIGGQSRKYIGIEHICRTQCKETLTNDLKVASGKLLRTLRNVLDIDLKPLKESMSSGVGVHQQFSSTGCGGNDVFWNGTHQSGEFGTAFWEILQVPSGRWEVHVGDYTWIYIFYDTGVVEWQKLSIKDSAKDTGTGNWTLGDNLHIKWNNGSIEDWKKPLTATATGRLTNEGEAGRTITERDRQIVARRLDLPK